MMEVSVLPLVVVVIMMIIIQVYQQGRRILHLDPLGSMLLLKRVASMLEVPVLIILILILLLVIILLQWNNSNNSNNSSSSSSSSNNNRAALWGWPIIHRVCSCKQTWAVGEVLGGEAHPVVLIRVVAVGLVVARACAAVGESSVIPLRPPLFLVGVSIGMERGRRENWQNSRRRLGRPIIHGNEALIWLTPAGRAQPEVMRAVWCAGSALCHNPR